MPLVMGIDPSLTGSALCVIDENLVMKKCFTFFPPKGKDRGVTRLIWLQDKLRSEIKEVLTQDSKIEFFIEGYAFAAHGQAVFGMAEIGAAYRMLLAKEFGGYYEIAPTVLKKYVCGKGNAKKELMLEQTFRRFNVGSDILTDNNMVDAFGIARAGATFMGYGSPTKADIECVKKISEKCVLK